MARPSWGGGADEPLSRPIFRRRTRARRDVAREYAPRHGSAHAPAVPCRPRGSLLRPPALLDARARHRAGDLDDAGLRAAEETAIRAAVALQRDAGMRTATDGEFRRTSWHMDFIYQLEGVDPTDQKLAVHFHNRAGDLDFETAALSVHDRVRLGHTIFGDAFEYLSGVTAGDQVPKLTIPSPNMVHYRGGRAAIIARCSGSLR